MRTPLLVMLMAAGCADAVVLSGRSCPVEPIAVDRTERTLRARGRLLGRVHLSCSNGHWFGSCSGIDAGEPVRVGLLRDSPPSAAWTEIQHRSFGFDDVRPGDYRLVVQFAQNEWAWPVAVDSTGWVDPKPHHNVNRPLIWVEVEHGQATIDISRHAIAIEISPAYRGGCEPDRGDRRAIDESLFDDEPGSRPRRLFSVATQ